MCPAITVSGHGFFVLNQCPMPYHSHCSSIPAATPYKPESAVRMELLGGIPPVNALSGFQFKHSGYDKKNSGMAATRTFIPPFTNV